MIDKQTLLDLADRLEAATCADRNLDAEIAEKVFGWKPYDVPPDCDGKNACEVLTPDGGPFLSANGAQWVYPSRGAVHRAFHCFQFSRDTHDREVPSNYIRLAWAKQIRDIANGKRAGEPLP